MKVKIVSVKIISNCFLRCFGIDGPILCKKFSEAFLSLFVHGQNNHPAQLAAKIALQSEKSQGFALFRWVVTLCTFILLRCSVM